MFLNPSDVHAIIKQAELEDEVTVIRCIRKGRASKIGGPQPGELYDLHCTKKPADYVPVGGRDRSAEDEACGVLTVYCSNRRDKTTGQLGAWRRVNLVQVRKVIYKGTEYEVVIR